MGGSRTMKHKSGIGETDWPRRARGGRRRATAEHAIRRQRLWGPLGWLIRVFLLIAIAVPSLIVTSPTYASYASKMPNIDAVATDAPGDTLISFEIEQRYSKEQILDMSPNAVFYGNSAAGSAAASQIFFHKKTADLTLGEAAMLAGLVRGPTYYSPLHDWNRAKARQKEV